jgi:hypothetical protein
MRAFGRRNSKDVLEALHQSAAAFREDPLNAERANHCAIDAWSLCDWIYLEHGQRLGLTTLADFQATVKASCRSLQLLQDVANASKHKEIRKYVPRLKEAKRHRGAFQRSAFSGSPMRNCPHDGPVSYPEGKAQQAPTASPVTAQASL